MNAAELVAAIKSQGGVLTLDGSGQIKCHLPKGALYMLELLREHKSEVIEIMKAHAGRIAAFPRCPRCTSYALYHRGNVGNYECLTCGLQDITEVTARRSNSLLPYPLTQPGPPLSCLRLLQAEQRLFQKAADEENRPRQGSLD